MLTKLKSSLHANAVLSKGQPVTSTDDSNVIASAESNKPRTRRVMLKRNSNVPSIQIDTSESIPTSSGSEGIREEFKFNSDPVKLEGSLEVDNVHSILAVRKIDKEATVSEEQIKLLTDKNSSNVLKEETKENSIDKSSVKENLNAVVAPLKDSVAPEYTGPPKNPDEQLKLSTDPGSIVAMKNTTAVVNVKTNQVIVNHAENMSQEESKNITSSDTKEISMDVTERNSSDKEKTIERMCVNSLTEMEEDAVDIFEDEEVLKIIGNFDEDLDMIEELRSEDMKQESVNAIDKDKLVLLEEMKTETGRSHEENSRVEEATISPSEELKSTRNSYENKSIFLGIKKPEKKIEGFVHHGPYSRVLFIVDGQLSHLESVWPSWNYVQPQILVGPRVTLEGLKDFILARTDLPHLENGTLLICSVGLHDIITFTDHKECKSHPPLKLIDVCLQATEDLIKLVLMRIKKAYQMLEETLDSMSVICFTAIVPCDPVLFFEQNAGHHKHMHPLKPALKSEMNTVKDKINIVCDRVNKHLSKMCALPTLWQIMASYHLDRKFGKCITSNGLTMKEAVVEELSFKLKRFMQELFYGLEINTKFLDFNNDQEIIMVGDSRIEEMRKMWNGDAPTFICEPDLGFYKFTEFVEKNLLRLKNKIVLVCLGMNDLIKFVDDDNFQCENHDLMKRAISVCHEYDLELDDYVRKVINNLGKGFKTFVNGSSSLMIFATVYPVDLSVYWNQQILLHKEKTGHSIPAPLTSYSSRITTRRAVTLLNMHLQDISKNTHMPLWNMYHVVCRGSDDLILPKDALKDGIFPSARTAEELVRSYHSFVNNKLNQESKEKMMEYKFPSRPLPNFTKYGFSDKPEGLQHLACSDNERRDYKETHQNLVQPSPSLSHRDVMNPYGNESKIEYKSQAAENISVNYNGSRNSRSSPLRRNKPSPLLPRNRSKSPGKDRYRRRSSSSDRHGRNSVSPSQFRGSRSHEAASISARFQQRNLEQRESSSGVGHFGPRSSRSPDLHRYKTSMTSGTPHHLAERSGSKYSPYQGGMPNSRSSSGSDLKEHCLFKYKESMGNIKRECQREGDMVIRNGLLDLFSSHKRECDMYIEKPAAYPDYNKEYRLFVERKRNFIQEIGGDPTAFDYYGPWRKYWPDRMCELFETSWSAKRDQYLSMIHSKKRRSFSSSSTSSSEGQSRKKRKHSKKKSSRKHHSPEPKKRQKSQHIRESRRDKYKSQSSDKGKNKSRSPERLAPAENIGTGKTQKDKTVKVVEVFGILSYMKDKLGPIGMPVSVLYDKALIMEKNGQDPRTLLDDEVSINLLKLILNKLVNLVNEEGVSTIQKAIYMETQSLLQDLIRDACEFKKKNTTLEIGVNVSQIATLSMGKSIHETIEIIEGFLLYEGYTDIPREKVEAIYLAVKDEQLNLNLSFNRYERRTPSVEPQTRNVEKKHGSPPENELTEEFFIGKQAARKPVKFKMGSGAPAQTSSISSMMMNASSSLLDHRDSLPSSSRSESIPDYDEEFFTGQKFRKPDLGNNSEGRNRNKSDKRDNASSEYVSRKHVLVPPPPIISGMTMQNPPELDVDYNALRKLLETIKRH